MKNDFKIIVVFNQEFIDKTRAEAEKTSYAKNSDERKKKELTAKLEKKAAEHNMRFQKRKLAASYNPVFNGCIIFSDKIKLDSAGLCCFADLFFEKIEKDFDVNIIDYSLKGIKPDAATESFNPNFVEFEVFNYNFNENKAIKSEFIKSQNVRKIMGIAEPILYELINMPAGQNEKAPKKIINSATEALKFGVKNKTKTEAGKMVYVKTKSVESDKSNENEQSPEKSTITAMQSEFKKATEKAAAARLQPAKPGKANKNEPFIDESAANNASLICETPAASNINEQISSLSFNWRLLSPVENIPVLEIGDPVEIYSESMVRIYFQKPKVRQVVWRFRKKPEFESSVPILRVYEDGNMLWYEMLDNINGSRYIIFSDDLELSLTWVEIGYLTAAGEFIFIARSSVWPPKCLSKKLPKINSDKKVPKGVRLIGIGATENISSGNKGNGFSNSGAGIE